MVNDMGFSATGNLLPGSVERPDTMTFLFVKESGSSWTMGSTNCKLNTYGYIPGVSTITGIGRALLGIVHAIIHLACSIFSQNRSHHLAEAFLGAKNIGRGLIEAIPIIGNITMFFVDIKRMNRFETMALDHVKNKAEYKNQSILFVYGQEIAKQPTDKVTEKMNSFGRKPTNVDLERIIRGLL